MYSSFFLFFLQILCIAELWRTRELSEIDFQWQVSVASESGLRVGGEELSRKVLPAKRHCDAKFQHISRTLNGLFHLDPLKERKLFPE